MVVISLYISLYLYFSSSLSLPFSSVSSRLSVSFFYLVAAVVSVRSPHIVCDDRTYTYKDGNQSPPFVKERKVRGRRRERRRERRRGRKKERKKKLCEYMSAQHTAHIIHTIHHTTYTTSQHTTHDIRHPTQGRIPSLPPFSLIVSSPSSERRVPDTPITAVSTRRRSISTASKNQYWFPYDSYTAALRRKKKKDARKKKKEEGRRTKKVEEEAKGTKKKEARKKKKEDKKIRKLTSIQCELRCQVSDLRVNGEEMFISQ